MFEELKKKILKSSLLGSIILIIAGLGLAGWNAMDAFYAATGYVDFTQLAPEQIKSQLVEVDLTESLGCYLEAYETNTKTHQSRTTHYYYIILTGDANTLDYRFMSAKVPASFGNDMDTITENFTNQILSDPLYLCGKIKKLDAEEYGYFKEYLIELGLPEDEVAESTLPYYINCFASKTSMNVMYLLLFGVGAFLLIWGIARVVNAASGSSLKKLRKDIANAGYSESTIDSD